MIQRVLAAAVDGERGLVDLKLPLVLHDLAPALPVDASWEVEIGSGKGRFLLREAEKNPDTGFLAIEVSSRYARLAHRRGTRRGLQNLVVFRAEALYLMAVVLPTGFARAVHVYFPDPWPKSRHNKRRLFDPETVDLVLSLLRPGGCVYFATDHLEYGELVARILAEHPGVRLQRRRGPWEDAPRTNYEAKYLREGRPILRLEARVEAPAEKSMLHPRGASGVLVALRAPRVAVSTPADLAAGAP